MLDLINVLLGNKQEGNQWAKQVFKDLSFHTRNGITVAWFKPESNLLTCSLPHRCVAIEKDEL